MADVNDDDAPATKRDVRELLRELEANLDARIDAKLDAKLDTKTFEAAKRELIDLISREISRAANATQDEMRRWFSLLLEKHDSDITAVNTNATQLRSEFEAHRDDTKVHVTRAARRRSRG